jgi:hypothetical protein
MGQDQDVGRKKNKLDDVFTEYREQTLCYTCGNKLGEVRWRCHICEELCCSEECRTKHIETMNAV